MTVPRWRRTALAAVGVLSVSLSAAGCSGDEEPEKAKPSATPTMVDGVTVPGLALDFGEPATVEWRVRAGDDVEVRAKLEATVEKARVMTAKEFSGYQLTKEMQASTPYFVDVHVKNLSDVDLGKEVVPLYLDNQGSTLFPSVDIPHFTKCSPRALPEKFEKGAEADLCLVFLAPEGTTLHSIALWADPAVEKIDWSGTVTDPAAEKRARQKEKKAEQEKKKGSASPSPSASGAN